MLKITLDQYVVDSCIIAVVIAAIQVMVIAVIQMIVITDLLHSMFLFICAKTIESSRLMNSIAVTAINDDTINITVTNSTDGTHTLNK